MIFRVSSCHRIQARPPVLTRVGCERHPEDTLGLPGNSILGCTNIYYTCDALQTIMWNMFENKIDSLDFGVLILGLTSV